MSPASSSRSKKSKTVLQKLLGKLKANDGETAKAITQLNDKQHQRIQEQREAYMRDMVGPPQPVRQAENRFERSMETVSRKFHHVLSCVLKLAIDIIRPKDSTFSSVHHKVAKHKSAPAFNNAIGAIDGTHVKVIIPFSKVGQYIDRRNEKNSKCTGYM
jgi:hypothetical protein